MEHPCQIKINIGLHKFSDGNFIYLLSSAYVPQQKFPFENEKIHRVCVKFYNLAHITNFAIIKEPVDDKLWPIKHNCNHKFRFSVQ
jgi:hypothetical protein